MMSDMQEKAPKLRYDLILIASLLVIALLALLISYVTREDGATIIIEYYGEQAAEYPLDKNATYELNGGTHILVVEDGEAYLSYASCPGQQCVHTGKVRYVGQSIVCAHYEVTVIIAGDDSSGVDIVT